MKQQNKHTVLSNDEMENPAEIQPIPPPKQVHLTSVEVESSSPADSTPPAANLLAKKYPWSMRFLGEFPWL